MRVVADWVVSCDDEAGVTDGGVVGRVEAGGRVEDGG